MSRILSNPLSTLLALSGLVTATLPDVAAATDCACDTFSSPVDITSTSTTESALEVTSGGGSTAISGVNNGTSAYQHGVFGRAYGSNGIGIYGIGSGTSGYGGYAVATGTSGTGLYASSTATSGTNYGVYALNASSSGRALYARNTASTGSTYGVYGLVASTSGTGVYGYTSPTTGYTTGVKGEARSSTGVGVFGSATSTSGVNYGVMGTTESTSGLGVFGAAWNSSGVNYGVWGASYSSTGYGLYSYGNFAATGTKSAIVPTSQGPTELYAEESTEIWFTDHGVGRLEGGVAHIDLDLDFLETVTVDEQHPLLVFVQLEGEANGVFVEKYEDGFAVIELMNGESDAPFSYRVMAKRAGYEDRRLRRVDVDLDPQIPSERRELPLKRPLDGALPAVAPAPKGAGLPSQP